MNTALIQQIVSEIGARRPCLQKRHPEVKTTEGRPRQYYFTQSTDSAEIDEIENITTSKTDDNVKEHDLFIHYYLNFYGQSLKFTANGLTKNILVINTVLVGTNGFIQMLWEYKNLSKEWHREIKDCVLQYFDKKQNFGLLK